MLACTSLSSSSNSLPVCPLSCVMYPRKDTNSWLQDSLLSEEDLLASAPVDSSQKPRWVDLQQQLDHKINELDRIEVPNKWFVTPKQGQPAFYISMWFASKADSSSNSKHESNRWWKCMTSGFKMCMSEEEEVEPAKVIMPMMIWVADYTKQVEWTHHPLLYP